MNTQDTAGFNQETLPSEYDGMTLKEFLESDLEGFEYWDGELLLMPPTSGVHGDITTNLVLSLGPYVYQKKLGRVYTSDTGFQIGDHMLIPDVAFISATRLPEERETAFSIPPDIAIEVISRSDSLYKVVQKALAYLEAGTQLVWVIEPIAKTVTVYRSETDIQTLTRNDTLTGEDVIEGFSCPVIQLFE